MLEMLRLRYIGGKAKSKLYFNRVRYIFNRENDFTENVPRMLWNFVKQTNEFIPAPVKEYPPDSAAQATFVKEPEPEKKSDKVICDICGFKARSPYGLRVHSRKHTREAK